MKTSVQTATKNKKTGKIELKSATTSEVGVEGTHGSRTRQRSAQGMDQDVRARGCGEDRMNETRIAKWRPNSRPSNGNTVGFVRDAATRVLGVLSRYPADAHELPIEALDDLADVYNDLHELNWYTPDVICWCVVKNYRDPDWKPAVWCGARTKEHAEKLRDGIAAHYDAEAKRNNWKLDEWTVELHACSIKQVIVDGLSAAQAFGWGDEP